MMKKIRLCLILHAPLGGGAERVMINLARHLDRTHFEIHLILFSGIGEYAGLLPKDILITDLKMDLPTQPYLTHPKWIWRLASHLKRLKPQLIFSTLGYTNLVTILARKLSGVKCLLIIRETVTLNTHLKQEKMYLIKKLIYKWLYPSADLIVAPTQSALEDLQGIISTKNGRVIPNCVDQTFIDQKLSEPETRITSLPKDKPVLISIGRLHKQKGLPTAIKALAEIHKTHPCYYWILGKGPEEEKLKSLVRELGLQDAVFFLGFQKNPYAYLQHADIFLLPSYYEGFPNILLEAMYCGVPAVVTNYDRSITDFIKNKEDGMIVPTGDPIQMAAAISELLTTESLYRSIQLKSSEKIKEFSINKMVTDYETLFLSLISP